MKCTFKNKSGEKNRQRLSGHDKGLFGRGKGTRSDKASKVRSALESVQQIGNLSPSIRLVLGQACGVVYY